MSSGLQFARMPGSSIAAPGAMGWVTDFLNAAFYARAREERSVGELRLAVGILTTAWERAGRRPGLATSAASRWPTPACACAEASGWTRRRSWSVPSACSVRGFPRRGRIPPGGATASPSRRRSWRSTSSPAAAWRTRRSARSLPPSPPRPAGSVRLPARGAAPPGARAGPAQRPGALAGHRLRRWPVHGAATRRARGADFEIEVALEPVPRAPVFTRGYVSATAVWEVGDPVLEASVAALEELTGGPILPEGGRPLLHHVAHPCGPLPRSRDLHLVLGEHPGGGGWVLDVGAWDPLPLPQAAAYRAGGREAQHAFWGPGDPELRCWSSWPA